MPSPSTTDPSLDACGVPLAGAAGAEALRHAAGHPNLLSLDLQGSRVAASVVLPLLSRTSSHDPRGRVGM